MSSKDKANQEEIYRAMRHDIEGGTYPASSRLPSVRTLAKRFNASPNTISKVVSRLMESGLCTARRGVGLFVRSLPTRKLTLLVGTPGAEPGDDVWGVIETGIGSRLGAEGIEFDRYHLTERDPPYGPAVERVRRPGRVVVCLGIVHEPYIKSVADLRRPMVIVGHAPNRCEASSILPNSFRSGYLAARHLIKRGRRNIAFVGRQRIIRQVALTEPESLKELAGLQCAFNEERLSLNPELIFQDFTDLTERASSLSTQPDGIIMPGNGGTVAIGALKSLGADLDQVWLGDSSLLAKPKHPAAVTYSLDAIIDATVHEIHRQLDENRQPPATQLVDTFLSDG